MYGASHGAKSGARSFPDRLHGDGLIIMPADWVDDHEMVNHSPVGISFSTLVVNPF